MKQAGTLKLLADIEKQYGPEEAKKFDEDLKNNRYTALGAIWQTKLHMEQMRQAASDEFHKQSK
jgi:hypothetical protein